MISYSCSPSCWRAWRTESRSTRLSASQVTTPSFNGKRQVDARLAQVREAHEGKVAHIRDPQGPLDQGDLLQEALALMTAPILQQGSGHAFLAAGRCA
jgi:hypothetical protein